MTSQSQSFFDRLTSPSRRSSGLPFHNPPNRLPSEYDLDELEPRPDHGLLPSDSSRERERYRTSESPRGRSQQWSDRASSVGSASKYRPRPGVLFAGPPPPIAASMVIQQEPERVDTFEVGQARQDGLLSASRAKVSSLWQENRLEEHRPQRSDSVWRGIQRQEKALELQAQQLLDLQAAGLVAGLGGRPPVSSDFDDHSDAGSSTPTGTFYSTATSKSRMINSLHIPTRANADGNVIPVRQPKKTKPLSLRGARTALRKSMLQMAELKSEEASHIDKALAQRKQAVRRIDQLGTRREEVRTQLSTLEEDAEEPLGQELRGLVTQHDTLGQEIHQLEQRLVSMRNRKRMLREKMEDVKNRREAGLSGYRGALRDVDEEVSSIMRHPPIQPLDRDIILKVTGEDETVESSGGEDFLRMIPSRRTLDMARSWWQSEMIALTKRRSQISSEQEALEEGGVMWSEVMKVVTDFEKRLHQAMRGPSEEGSSPNGKGKEKVPSQEEVLREQLPLMDESIKRLQAYMDSAESRNWNLLICAIGAELEAFREAFDLLKGAVEGWQAGHEKQEDGRPGTTDSNGKETENDDVVRDEPESDDNEVPLDLISSAIHKPVGDSPEQRKGSLERRESSSSENVVPAEFLLDGKHDKVD